MKKKCIILTILLVSVIVPFQLMAQSTDVFRQEGIASWYGREFEGRPTASGEIFDSSQLTAAHPSLPFGTRLVITNQHNNRSVTVRVNDRGPFVPARIIDVSRAAAEQLDMITTGTAPVSVVSIDRIVISNPAVGAQVIPSSPSTAAPVIVAPIRTVPAAPSSPIQPSAQVQPIANALPSTSSVITSQPTAMVIPAPQLRITPELAIAHNKNYRFQVGSFRNARNAVEAFDRLKNSGLSPAYERFTNTDNVEYYRVVVAGVPGLEVQYTSERIVAAGFREAILREEN